jgi:hypothetical protein
LKSGVGDGAKDSNRSNEINEKVNIDNLSLTEKLAYRWKQIQKLCFKIVEHKYFELFIILMIVLSSFALVRKSGRLKIKKLTLIIFIYYFKQGYGRHKYSQ